MSHTQNYNLFITDDKQTRITDWLEEMAGESNSNMTKIDTELKELDTDINSLESQVAGLTSIAYVNSTSEMTDTSRTYVNMSNGNWYQYENGSWVSHGQYGGAEIDDDLDTAGAAADAKATGDAIDELKSQLSDDVDGIGNALTYLDNGEMVFNFSLFEHGTYYTSSSPTSQNMVRTKSFISFDRKIVATAKTGFKIKRLDAPKEHDTGWVDSVTLNANTAYYISIRRDPSDESEIANIVEFVSNVTFESLINERLTGAENLLKFSTSQNIEIEQGYWAIADGAPTSATNWCRTAGYLDRDALLTTGTLQMYLLAYDADGSYVGAWNGSEFSTTYAQSAYLQSIKTGEWVDQYHYQFKIDFRNGGQTVTPSAVNSDLTVQIYSAAEMNYLESVMLEADVTGERKLNPSEFTLGSLYNGNLQPSNTYRVSMKAIHSLPHDVTIVVKNGYRLSVNLFTDGVYTGYEGWITTEYTITKNQQFKLMIGELVDDTGTVADIDEFVNGIYIKTLALKDAILLDGISEYASVLSTGFRYVYHFGMEYVTERTVTPPVIPSQSIYDVRNAKNLGFECIEANVYKTSDNKYVVTHSVSGKLGHDFDDLNGNDAGDQDVVISQNTLSYLQTNFRYRSSVPEYRVPITTLEDFLSECSRVGIKVMQMYCDQASLQIGLNIMGWRRIWFYGAPRSAYPGPITNWRKLMTKAAIVADCESYGRPYVYSMGNPGDFTDDELEDIAQTLHSMGYQLMTAYRTNAEMDKLASFGWDYFILGNNTFREPVVFNGKQINFNVDGSVTWTAVMP